MKSKGTDVGGNPELQKRENVMKETRNCWGQKIIGITGVHKSGNC